MLVLTLAIISSFLDVDGRPERGSLSTEVLPSLKSSQIIIYVVTYISWQAASGMKFEYKAYQMWASIVHLSADVHNLW